MAVNAEVKVRPNESIEKAIRRFSKMVRKSGILDEVREKQYYEKPSVKKKKKRQEAARRRWVEERRAEKREAKKSKDSYQKRR